jgi:regulator of replication initiation timing
LSFGQPEVAAQAATDKSLLKAQVDDLVAKNTSLKTKADGLVVEDVQLRADQAKAQELFNKHQAEAESREKNLQQCLQHALDSLRGKFYPLFSLKSAKIFSSADSNLCFS